jgi:pyruvate kinase
VQSEDISILPRISRFRPRGPIFFASESEEKLRRSKIIWGVYPVKTKEAEGHRSSAGLLQTLEMDGSVKQGGRVVVIREAAEPAKDPGFSLSVSIAGGRKN